MPVGPSWLGRLVHVWAIAGGLLLCAVALMTVASILGRAIGRAWPDGPLGPVPGDFELVELGVGIAVFSFLPWCHWRGGNVSVALLARHLPTRLTAVLGRAAEAVFAVLVALVLAQLVAGARDLARFGETTMVLRLPVWWAYGPAIASAALWLAVILVRLFGPLRPADDGLQGY